MRVIAGRFGGRHLRAPRGYARTRPTSDRVREATFAILGELAGARVLDLFAGTGALGIEALSRGAERAVFVERDRAALRALRVNLQALGLVAPAAGGWTGGAPAEEQAGEAPAEVRAGEAPAEEQAGEELAEVRMGEAPAEVRAGEAFAEVRAGEALAALRLARERCEAYDLVFLDPPYGAAEELGESLSASLPSVLGPAARVVAESDRRSPLQLTGFTPLTQRRYGDTLIVIYNNLMEPAGARERERAQ